MGATASYTITYGLTGPPGNPPTDINILYKENGSSTYTLAHTQVNAAAGQSYTWTFNNLPSHTVYQVKVESVCQGNVTQFGDIQ